MANATPDAPGPTLLSQATIHLGIWCAFASGIASVFSILFLLLFIVFGSRYGPLNDIFVKVQYPFMAPIAFVLFKLLGSSHNRRNQSSMATGILSILAIIVLHAVLVFGTLPFYQRIFFLILAFLMNLA
ncbi:MAG: hypothetical protein HQ507_03845 [Candidatus Marinimicrobia bacterium]|nr:hypothetical protein [Candidatus Neomarinimicrobiota bacterium]